MSKEYTYIDPEHVGSIYLYTVQVQKEEETK